MKADQKMFEAVADLVRKGLSVSRAARVLKMSPDTVSRWRAELPEFAEMVDQAESEFIERMTTCIADAAPTDWRAAAEILARRFPAEFSRDSMAASRVPEAKFRDQEGELLEMARSPMGRRMLLGAGMIDAAWLAKNFPQEAKSQLALCAPAD